MIYSCLYAPRIDRLVAYCFTGVCLSVCLSICLSAENLTCELNIFLLLPYYSSYNAHIWYAGSFRQHPTSEGHNIKAMVIFFDRYPQNFIRKL